jgi:hypothetical protein
MRCTSCGSENPTNERFCSDCGRPFGGRCPKCGAKNPDDKKFFGDTLADKATTLIATTQTVETPAPEIRMRAEQSDASATADGERKTVSALFGDIKSSTELMHDLDPEKARAIVDPVLYDGGVASLRRLRCAINGRWHLRFVRCTRGP